MSPSYGADHPTMTVGLTLSGLAALDLAVAS